MTGPPSPQPSPHRSLRQVPAGTSERQPSSSGSGQAGTERLRRLSGVETLGVETSADNEMDGHRFSTASTTPHQDSPGYRLSRPPPARLAPISPLSSSPVPLSPHSSDRAWSVSSPRLFDRDLEKQELPRSPCLSRPDSSCSTLQDRYSKVRNEEDIETLLKAKALKILIYLSGIETLVSIAIAFWTLLALLIVLFLQPLRLFRRPVTFGDQLIRLLSPALRTQLSLIYSTKSSGAYNATLLTITHLLSPLVSFGVSIAAWTAAVFWFYAAILGDPNGSDKPRGYNDGKASVLGVRSWWEHWLTRSLR